METQAHIMSTSQSARGSRWLLVCLVSWGLVACQKNPPPPAPALPPAPPPAPPPRPSRDPAPAPVSAAPAGAREYQVVAADSLLQIMVFRGGAMARLGHNHVIASHQLAGTVYVTDDALRTRFDISFPVNDIT